MEERLKEIFSELKRTDLTSEERAALEQEKEDVWAAVEASLPKDQYPMKYKICSLCGAVNQLNRERCGPGCPAACTNCHKDIYP